MRRQDYRCILAVLVLVAMPGRAEKAAADFVFGQEVVAEDPLRSAWRRGELAMDDALYDLAVSSFAEYLRLAGNREPERALGCSKLAEAYMALGRHGEAEQSLTQYDAARASAALDPARSRWLRLVRAQLLFNQGQWGASAAILREIWQPGEADAQNMRVVLLYADALALQKEWPAALQVLQSQLASGKGEAAALFPVQERLAKAHLALGDFAAAARLLASIPAPASEEDLLSSKTMTIIALAGLNETDRAFAAYQEIAARCPAKADARWWKMLWQLAEVLFNGQKFAEAADVLNKALLTAASAENRVKTQMLLAEVLRRQGRWTEARSMLENARRDAADNKEQWAQATLQLGQLLSENRSWQTAAAIFAEVAEGAVPDGTMRYEAALQQGKCLAEAGDVAAAALVYRQAAAKIGDDPDKAGHALMSSAALYEQAGQAAVSVVVYQEVLNRYPRSSFAANARFSLGRVLMQAGNFSEARRVYEQFLEAHPQSERRFEARLEAAVAGGRASRGQAEATARMIAELRLLAQEDAAVAVAPAAVYEACRLARTLGDQRLVIAILQEAMQKYPASPELPVFIYHSIQAFFLLGEETAAIEQAERLFASYPQHPVAANVTMQLGDHFSSQGDYERARHYYGEVFKLQLSGPLFYIAGYELARCQNSLGEPESARATLEGLVRKFTEEGGEDRQLKAKMEMLLGDILLGLSFHEEAKERFTSVRNEAKDSVLGYEALLRKADVCRVLASANTAFWSEALECLDEILKENSRADSQLREAAQFRRAKCYEGQGRNEEALEEYKRIYLNYMEKRLNSPNVPYYYYYQSVFAATRLLALKGDADSLRAAVRMYESLGASGLPRAEEAAALAAEIRSRHHIR